jgi:TonB family protein
MPACLVALGVSLFLLVSQGVPLGSAATDPPNSQDPQAQAEALLEHARQLSDIREDNNHPFILKAQFSFVGEELKVYRGTYTESWISESKWRREIVIGNMRRVEIASDSKFFVTESDPSLPQKATRVEFATSLFPARTANFRFESIRDRSPGESATKCAITAPIGARRVRHAFCFDTLQGELVESIAPSLVHERLTDLSCQYSNFNKFGNQWFPHDMECLQSGHHLMEVHVVDLASNSTADPATLLTPPRGAIELGRCMAGAVPPRADSTPPPIRPAGLRDRTSSVTVRMVVDRTGNPEDIHVIESGGKPFDDQAVGAVQRWHFKPATCNGEPIASQIDYAVDFRNY